MAEANLAKEEKEILEFDKNSEWAVHNDDLRPQYASKYVAVLNRGVIDYDDKLDVLRERLVKKYNESEVNCIAIWYVNNQKSRDFMNRDAVLLSTLPVLG
jgi:hypothetical protein